MSSETSFETWLKLHTPALPGAGVAAVLKLTAEGASIPFITRYRKEATGNLDEVAIRQILDAKESYDRLARKKAQALQEIEAQGKLTAELRTELEQSLNEDRVDDLFAPFKKKRKTKAEAARQAGLEPYSDWIWNALESPLKWINPSPDPLDAEAALEGAKHILIEKLSENPELRALARGAFRKAARFTTKKSDQAKENSKYESYFDFGEKFSILLDARLCHRYHALRRGWMEDELKLTIEGPDTEMIAEVEKTALQRPAERKPALDSECVAILRDCARQAWKNHLRPSVEAELHRDLKAAADESAAGIFASNLKKLLLAAPLGAKNVVGIDPGIRTGCKLAIVDAAGKYLTNTILELQTEAGRKEAEGVLTELATKLKIEAFAVGNGTFGREAERFIRAALKTAAEKSAIAPPAVVMVSESGASIYSVSDDARKEFPELDATVRSAISIARRLQDPLAELIRVDPKSVGVGQYQHDVNDALMKKKLDGVVEDCVNSVGIDANTASEKLLSYVSGIGPAIAKSIVATRKSLGGFTSREDLKKVTRLQGKVYELAAGFLRIRGGTTLLDATAVHPERYSALEAAAKKLGTAIQDLIGAGAARLRDLPEFGAEVGDLTLEDIVSELSRPGRDPRG
ncbi:MAG: Tex-like N-terminal domain-containing protein, partial [Bdellovibrionota bacterium]